MVRRKPHWFIATMTKRKGKIFLDYFRNNRRATSILPYSTRTQPGAPVALPVSGRKLTEDFLSHPLNVKETIDRLERMKKDLARNELK
jgi:bifunctional non-homologous end joining protein LigD